MDEDVSYLELDNVAALMSVNDDFDYDALEPPITEAFDEKYTFSKIILDMVNKVHKLMDNDDGPRFQRFDKPAEDEEIEDKPLEEEEESRPTTAFDAKGNLSFQSKDPKKDEDELFDDFAY